MIQLVHASPAGSVLGWIGYQTDRPRFSGAARISATIANMRLRSSSIRASGQLLSEAADQQGVAVCAIDTQHVDLGPACGGEDDLPDAQQRRSFSHAKKI